MPIDHTIVSQAPVPHPVTAPPVRLCVHRATTQDREEISQIRHEVYARELGQHPQNNRGQLQDALDGWNVYLVVKAANEMAGFVSLTPPGAPSYSIDKYFPRNKLPFTVGPTFFEVRLLTVLPSHRRSEVALLLMYAALRWIEAGGGEHLAAIGRQELVELYTRVGLCPLGLTATSGRVRYELMHASLSELRERLGGFGGVLERLESKADWQLTFPFRKPASCFHGGAFFNAIGERFEALERREQIINADVLDAPYPPAPRVIELLQEHLPWLLSTSPPTDCGGLQKVIAESRRVRPAHILPGAGSSDLIFRALRHWLSPASHVLLLDPTYGEYRHVLEAVIGCTVDGLVLPRAQSYEVDLARLRAALADNYDLVVLVNPNSPTGRHIPRALLEELLRTAPSHTRIWVDETYVDYAGPGESLEPFAASSDNVIVCKSMSKIYALSGARVGYLCAGPHHLESLRAITPPWVVSLPAQLAAVQALQAPAYYAARLSEVARDRQWLHGALENLGWEVVPSVANFLLCHLPAGWPDAETLVHRCRQAGLFIRNASTMGSALGARAVRIAVKDPTTNQRMLDLLVKAGTQTTT